MSTSIGELKGVLSLEDRFSSGFEAAGRVFDRVADNMGDGFKKISAAAGIVSAAVLGAVGTIAYMADKGSKINDVERAFDRLAGSAGRAEEIFSAMDRGVAGTVDSLELMEFANKALGNQSIKTAEQFSTVTQAARVFAREGLGDIQTNMDKIAGALATGRVKTLQYMTGVIDLKAAEDKYARQLGVTRKELTANQKVLADRGAIFDALNRKIEQTGTLEKSLSEKFTSARLIIGNWFDDLSKRVASSIFVTKMFDDIGAALVRNFGGTATNLQDLFVEWIDKFAMAVSDYGPGIIKWAKDVWDWIGNIVSVVKKAWDSMPDWLKTVTKDALIAGAAVWALREGASALSEQMFKMAGAGGNGGGFGIGDTATTISGLKDTIELMKIYGGDVMIKARTGILGVKVAFWELKDVFMGAAASGGMIAVLKTASDMVVGLAGNLLLIPGRIAAIGTAGVVAMGALASAGVLYGLDKMMGGRARFLAKDIERSIYGDTYTPNTGYDQLGPVNIRDVGPNAPGFVAGGVPDLREAEERAKVSEELLKKIEDATQASIKRTTAFWEGYYATVDRAEDDFVGSTLRKLQRRFDAERAELDKSKKLNANYYNELLAMTSLFDAQALQVHFDFIEQSRKAAEDAAASIARDMAGMNAFVLPSANSPFGGTNNIPNMGTLPGLPNPNVTGKLGKQYGERFLKGFSDGLKDFPNILIDALTGGGGIGNAFQALGANITNSLFGEGGPLNDITNGLSKSIGGGLSKFLPDVLGKVLGDSIAAILPGIGGLIAPLVSKLFTALSGGPSQAELEGRKIVADFEKGFEGVDDMIESVGAAYRDVGLSSEQAMADVEALWRAEKAGAEATQAALEKINKTLRIQKELNESRKELADLEKQLGRMQLDNLHDILGPLATQVERWRELGDQIDDAKKDGTDFKKLQEQQAKAITYNADQIRRFGVIAVASFEAALESGMDFMEALEIAGPDLATLYDAFAAVGVSSENAFMKTLAIEGKVLANNPALLKAIAALGSSFTILDHLGQLNESTFRDLEKTGLEMYTELQAQVAAVGGGTREALLPMQDYLHRALEEAENLQIPLDENTQLLIDQSKELGIWKDKGKSAADILIERMQTLTDRIFDLVEMLAKIHDVEFKVTGTVVTPEMPDIPGSGSPKPDQPAVPEAMGTNGIVYAAGPATFTTRGNEYLQFWGEGQSPETGGTTVNETHNHYWQTIDGDSVRSFVRRPEFQQAMAKTQLLNKRNAGDGR